MFRTGFCSFRFLTNEKRSVKTDLFFSVAKTGEISNFLEGDLGLVLEAAKLPNLYGIGE